MADDFYWTREGRLVFGDKSQEEPKATGNNKNMLFVYGTLRFHNKHMLKGGVLVRKNIAAPECYYLGIYKGHLPVMMYFPNGGGGIVVGDVYLVSDDMLKEIDALKLKGRLYSRQPIVLGDYGEYKCETYMYPKPSPGVAERKNIVIHEEIQGDYGKYLDSLINEEDLLNG